MPDPVESQVRVLVFGPAARAVGAAGVLVRATLPIAAGALMRELHTQHPVLGFALANARLAVNHAVAPADATVRAGDEVALIALVDGG